MTHLLLSLSAHLEGTGASTEGSGGSKGGSRSYESEGGKRKLHVDQVVDN